MPPAYSEGRTDQNTPLIRAYYVIFDPWILGFGPNLIYGFLEAGEWLSIVVFV